jgi:hypothetical protein
VAAAFQRGCPPELAAQIPRRWSNYGGAHGLRVATFTAASRAPFGTYVDEAIARPTVRSAGGRMAMMSAAILTVTNVRQLSIQSYAVAQPYSCPSRGAIEANKPPLSTCNIRAGRRMHGPG